LWGRLSSGLIDLYEVSFDTPLDLKSNQDGLGNGFTLATLQFKGLVDGITDLVLSGTFGNEFGLGFAHDVIDGKIIVGDRISVVPLPAALPLYGAGLAVMGFIGWRRKRRT